jgi:hypothetical protein
MLGLGPHFAGAILAHWLSGPLGFLGRARNPRAKAGKTIKPKVCMGLELSALSLSREGRCGPFENARHMPRTSSVGLDEPHEAKQVASICMMEWTSGCSIVHNTSPIVNARSEQQPLNEQP